MCCYVTYKSACISCEIPKMLLCIFTFYDFLAVSGFGISLEQFEKKKLVLDKRYLCILLSGGVVDTKTT